MPSSDSCPPLSRMAGDIEPAGGPHQRIGGERRLGAEERPVGLGRSASRSGRGGRRRSQALGLLGDRRDARQRARAAGIERHRRRQIGDRTRAVDADSAISGLPSMLSRLAMMPFGGSVSVTPTSISFSAFV